jgi:hypothetical protein
MPPLGPYGWPLRPFHRAHPVRGYFNDPRVSGSSRAFHFGIDISAADGTPVFAVEQGRVHLEGGRSLAVAGAGGRIFGYWHVVPAVKHHQEVRRHQLLGHVEPTWGHVHFAETSRRAYRNPLRAGALTPWVDATSPRIAGIQFLRGKTVLSPLAVSGQVDVVVEAWDKPPLPIPPPWSDAIVTPALVRWRVLRGREVVRPWHAPVDFRKTLLPASLYAVVYAPGTAQNHPGKPGRYRFFVAHTWDTRRLRNGLYRLEVSVADISGNRAHAALPFTLANRR